ncbi:MAG: SpoIIE family protein phosphatase [Planctomycetes bacterium]|nr:SpoIIE family protein phosphatase [Planctomycetota bacterium]
MDSLIVAFVLAITMDLRAMKIKHKTLMIGLVLPVSALLLLTAFSWYYLRALAMDAIKSNTDIGDKAAKTSENSLREYTSFLVQNIVNYRANYADERLRRLWDSAKLIGVMAEDVYLHAAADPKDAILTPNRLPPSSIITHAAPGADPAGVARENFLHSQLDEIMHLTREIHPRSGVYIGGSQGTIRMARADAATSHYAADYDPRQRGWYQQAVKEGKAGWTSVYRGASSRELMVTIFNPVYGAAKRPAPGNQPDAVVAIDVPVAKLADEILANQDISGSMTFLLDAKGTVIQSSLPIEGSMLPYWEPGSDLSGIEELRPMLTDLAQRRAGMRLSPINGQLCLVAYAPVPTPGWSLGIVIPDEVLLAAPRQVSASLHDNAVAEEKRLDDGIRTNLMKYLVAALVSLGVMSFISLRIARRIVNSIHELSTGAARIGDGNFSAPITVNSDDELQTLAGDFNRMAEQLQDYTAKLITAKRWEGEMAAASEIQNNMLPQVFPPFPEHEEFTLFARMVPAREIGGDLYDFFLVGDDRICLLVGDVSGKGIPAAMFMVVGKTLIKHLILGGEGLSRAITDFNRIIAAENASNYFLTMFVALINYRTGETEFVDAGHNPPMFMPAADCAYEPVGTRDTKNPAIGMTDDWEFRSGRLNIGHGGRLFIYSDGVTEAENVSREHFGEAALISALEDGSDLDDQRFVMELNERLVLFAGGQPAADDVTMLMFTRK